LLIDPRPPIIEKRLALAVRSQELEAILAALLHEWQFTLLPHPAAGTLLLAEEGCLAETDGEIVWLTTSRYVSRQRLALPLQLQELWSALETRFHKPPRNHLRVAVDCEATLCCRGGRSTIRLVSLSDMGARLVFPRELISGEELVLEYPDVDGLLELAGRVIYVLPRGELAGTNESEAGMIFDRTPAETRERVRNRIIVSYLERVRRQLPESVFCAGLGFFDLPAAVLRQLGCPDTPAGDVSPAAAPV
jgi:hypothetical protein